MEIMIWLIGFIGALTIVTLHGYYGGTGSANDKELRP
jgi:hypothetical protein